MKKLMLGASSVMGVASAFAVDGTVTITDNATAVSTAVTTWASTFAPALLTIAGAFLGFWVIKIGLRLIKGIASSSK